ncbi:MAG: BMP family ABC transporter substrate-binding protein [Acidimicrobiia bacterium]|nr:BMP family ABC transporter substrate-binding protein [Acidimicrobiia bacterium]
MRPKGVFMRAISSHLKPLSAALCIALLLGACSSERNEVGDKFSVCQEFDGPQIRDRSFNQNADAGLIRAERELNITAIRRNAENTDDYRSIVQGFLARRCDLIITNGMRTEPEVRIAAKQDPSQNFSVLDATLQDDSEQATTTEKNVEEITFETDQAAFLAGYLAAGVTKTGIIGTYGGMQISPVTVFMDGLSAGIKKYNEDHSTSVTLLGWDGANGRFVGNFTDRSTGQSITREFIDAGADIIMPLGGGASLGTVAEFREKQYDDRSIIWADVDGCTTLPGDCKYFLTTVEKRLDNAVFEAIESAVNDDFKGTVRTETLTNNGVGLAPFHTFDSRVPASLKKELAKYRSKIIAGTQPTR